MHSGNQVSLVSPKSKNTCELNTNATTNVQRAMQRLVVVSPKTPVFPRFFGIYHGVSGRFRGADVFADQPLLEHNK